MVEDDAALAEMLEEFSASDAVVLAQVERSRRETAEKMQAEGELQAQRFQVRGERRRAGGGI